MLTSLRPSSAFFYAYESLVKVRKIEWNMRWDIAEDLQVRLDVEKFEKIVNNLLSNAIKFTPAYGQVTLEVMDYGSHQLRISVQDSGPGIRAADLPKIFNRFYQGGRENEPLRGGDGHRFSPFKRIGSIIWRRFKCRQ